MVVRHVVAALVALSITFGLFYVMQLLISMGSGRGADISKGNVIEFVRIKRESALQEKKRKLPKKEKPPEPPPPPDLQMSSPDSADSGEMAEVREAHVDHFASVIGRPPHFYFYSMNFMATAIVCLNQ